MRLAFNSLVALLLTVGAFLIFRRGHDALFKDWRRGVLLFVVCYVLLEAASAAQRAMLAQMP